MLFGRIVLPIALAMALLAPTLASAQEVNRSLAANPDAVMAELEAMNLTPLSDEVAGEIRGEGLMNDVVGTIIALSISYNVSSTAFLGALSRVYAYYGWSVNLATTGARALGWELGRMLALKDGNPDIGPFYAPSNYAQFLPWYVQMGRNILINNL